MKDNHIMRLRSRVAHVGGGLLLGLALAGGGYAIAASATSHDIHGCVARNHALLVQPRCGRGQRRLIFSARGPAGARGVTGPVGPGGPTGPQGPPGKDGVALWARVDAAGNVVAQNGRVTVTKAGTGAYQVLPANYEGPCATTATAESLTSTSKVPILAQVQTTGTIPGSAIVVVLTNMQTLTQVDDGFSVMVQCSG